MYKMSWITTNLKQTACYWANPVSDGIGGYTYDDPVELLVRWQDSSKKFIDANGEEKVSQAIVFVGQDVDVGGYFYLGDLDDLSSAEEADPETITGAYRIRALQKSPALKGTLVVRKVWL